MNTLREQIAGMISEIDITFGGNRFYCADAAIKLITEECAKVADNWGAHSPDCRAIATAIRALKDRK